LFPFDRGKMDCYLFPSGPPCLQAIVICVKTGQSMFSQIQSIVFDWKGNVYGIVRDASPAILPTCLEMIWLLQVLLCHKVLWLLLDDES